MNEKKAIVLGGTAPHAMLINKLKKRGYYVILVDYLKESPGKKVADKHICESTLDLDKVYDIAKRENVSLVISTCIDQANLTCCYVAEKLNLTKPCNCGNILIIAYNPELMTETINCSINGVPRITDM